MKRNRLFVLLVTLLLFLGVQNGFSQRMVSWDKGNHFVAGTIIGGVGATLSTRPVLAGTICGLGAGIAKEWHDHRYHNAGFDAADVIFTTAGGIASGLIIRKLRTILFNKHHKNKRK